MDKMTDYKGKYFSVLGDSISTLVGYSEPIYAEFYDTYRKNAARVFTPQDTWWGRVIDTLGGELLVNNSISGSLVSMPVGCEIESYGCSNTRTSSLGREGISPDVIMIYLGTNDYGYGMRLFPEYPTESEDISFFSVAYATMLKKLKANYPSAEIWCLTLPTPFCSANAGLKLPLSFRGRHIEEYCSVIADSARAHGCRVIDLYAASVSPDTIDGLHPNADGMKVVADAIIELL